MDLREDRVEKTKNTFPDDIKTDEKKEPGDPDGCERFVLLVAVRMTIINRPRGDPDTKETDDVGRAIREGMKPISGHAGRTGQPTIKELCTGHPPVENEDINQDAPDLSKSVFGVLLHFLLCPF
jgi:hypothetical protein